MNYDEEVADVEIEGRKYNLGPNPVKSMSELSEEWRKNFWQDGEEPFSLFGDNWRKSI